jgi:3-hydroxyisobutyrate dehydrogenase-like beta-hydroxyacid dehydrogenase
MKRRGKQGVVGQIGLGIMGGAFAKHLLAAGFDVIGYDVSADALKRLTRGGGKAAGSVQEVAEGARIIITSLPSPKAMEQVFFGEQGLASHARKGAVVIEASTMTLELKERIRRSLERRGVEALDCPISGTGAQASAKDIAVYASGSRSAYNRCRAVFAGFARSNYYCGAYGTGSKLKFVANLLVTIHNLSTAEAMVVGEKAGIDLDLLYKVIADGAGTSRMFEVRGAMMVARHYLPPHMKAEIYQKDIDIISGFVRKMKCPTPLFDSSLPLYSAALRAGLGQEDTAAIHAVLRERARLGRVRGSRRKASAPR